MKDLANGASLRRKTGRPLSFDRDAALEKAMLTFWRHGYETTSIVDLTTAMGVSAPSLYTAFGDKQGLFLEAVRLYAGDPQRLALQFDMAPTAFDAAHDMLVAAATSFTSETTPKGCLLASATASGSPAAADVQLVIADLRAGIVAQLQARIERDIGSSKIAGDVDAAALAGLVIAVIQGMSVLARDGATQTALLAIGEAVLKAWPS